MPSHRVGPSAGPSITAPAAPPEAHLDALRQRLAPGRGRAGAGPAIFIRHYRFHPAQAPGWHAARERHSTAPGLAGVLRVTRARLAQDSNPARSVRLDVYETVSHEVARELLLHLLTGFELLPQQLGWEASADWAAPQLGNERLALFARGNLAVLMASIGATPANAATLAARLDAFLSAEAGMPGGAMGAAADTGADTRAEPMLRYTVASGNLRQRPDGTVGADDAAAAQAPLTHHFDEMAQGWRPSQRERTPPTA